MIARWEKELAESKSADVAQSQWEKTSFNPDVAPIACICVNVNGESMTFHLDEYICEFDLLLDFHSYIDNTYPPTRTRRLQCGLGKGWAPWGINLTIALGRLFGLQFWLIVGRLLYT